MGASLLLDLLGLANPILGIALVVCIVWLVINHVSGDDTKHVVILSVLINVFFIVINIIYPEYVGSDNAINLVVVSWGSFLALLLIFLFFEIKSIGVYNIDAVNMLVFRQYNKDVKTVLNTVDDSEVVKLFSKLDIIYSSTDYETKKDYFYGSLVARVLSSLLEFEESARTSRSFIKMQKTIRSVKDDARDIAFNYSYGV